MANFSKKLKEAVSGETKQYASLNLSKNPFLPNVNLEESEELFVGRTDSLNDFARSVSDLASGQLSVITILGSKGIGKTHFLVYVFNELKKIQEKAPFGDVIFIKTFGDFSVFRNQYFHSSEKIKTTYLLIDEAENIWENENSLNFLLNLIGKKEIKIIWAWNRFSWNSAKQDSYTLPKTKTILLEKLTNQEIFEILKRRVAKTLIVKNAHPIEDDALNLLAQVGDGVPYTAISTAERCLHFALNKQRNVINAELVREFFREYEININQKISPELEEILRNITPSEKKVLREVYTFTTSYTRKGITTTGLSKKLGITTPSASVHLSNLTFKKKILERIAEKGKRDVYYRIRAEYLIWLEKFLQTVE